MRPWPGGPAWMMFSQNACSTGFSAANVASSAPTMMLSRPCSASTGVRASGASTNCTPERASASRIFVVVAGSRGRRVDDDQPGARGAGDAVLAMDDLLDLRRAGDAEEHDVGSARDVRVGRDFLRAGSEQVRERRPVASARAPSAESPW